MKKAIIIGATSGIGRALAEILSQDGYVLGLVGRRNDCLEELKKSLSTQVFTRQIDVAETAKAIESLTQLIEDMQGVDLVVISAGIGFINPDLNWSEEKATIDTNVSGFTAMANVAFPALRAYWNGASGRYFLHCSPAWKSYGPGLQCIQGVYVELSRRAATSGRTRPTADRCDRHPAGICRYGHGTRRGPVLGCHAPGSGSADLSSHSTESETCVCDQAMADYCMAVAHPARLRNRQAVINLDRCMPFWQFAHLRRPVNLPKFGHFLQIAWPRIKMRNTCCRQACSPLRS